MKKLVWLDAVMVDRLAAMRGPGEDYSDVILRIAGREGARRGRSMAVIWKYSRIVWAGLIGVIGAALGGPCALWRLLAAEPQVEPGAPIAKELSPSRALLSGEADAKICRSQWEAEEVMINVYIDSNVWNFLFERPIDLAVALPSDKFCLYIPREAEPEVRAIRPEKAELKAFIEATLAKCGVRTDSLFGFHDDSLPPDEQRVGGFDDGRWNSSEEMDFIARQRAPNTAKKRPTTPLYPNEADISLAARAFARHSVVLSLDDKRGPIRDASQQGGKVVFLTGFDNSGLSLSDFILKELGRPE